MASESKTIVAIQVLVPPEAMNGFADWQAKLNRRIALFPGFISLEILSSPHQPLEWTVVQRFNSVSHLRAWRTSLEREELLKELKELLANEEAIQDREMEVSHLNGVTEVFITQVNPQDEEAYRKWTAKIHQVEAKFPGFRGMYVQSPTDESQNWITLLQFDTPENLERWLSSPERQEVLRESQPLIASLESHRVVSPYASWFTSVASNGKQPPAWKQSMIVLLMLFPIVMLEGKLLPFVTGGLHPAVSMFISNAISVSLLTWPAIPFAVKLLRWWLSPNASYQTSLKGTALVIGLYLLEILIFLNI